MARRLWAVAAGVVFVSACGTPNDPKALSTTEVAPEVTQATQPTQVSSDGRGVAVQVTGVLSAGTTLCPAQELTCGYGLKLDGVLGAVSDGDFVTGKGWYDGHRVLVAGQLATSESPFVQSASPRDTTFSDVKLRQESDDVSQLMSQGIFIIQGGFSIDERRNRVVVPIEAIDAGGRAALEQLKAVTAVPFIELLDRPLGDLPKWHPAVEGTVDLLTYAARVNGGMAALIRLTLQFDIDGNCLFAEVDGQRYAVVWPFGYSATDSNGTIAVFDPSGRQVAVTGQPIELGGGNDSGVGDGGVGGWVDRATYGSSCDAEFFWIVNGG